MQARAIFHFHSKKLLMISNQAKIAKKSIQTFSFLDNIQTLFLDQQSLDTFKNALKPMLKHNLLDVFDISISTPKILSTDDVLTLLVETHRNFDPVQIGSNILFSTFWK